MPCDEWGRMVMIKIGRETDFVKPSTADFWPSPHRELYGCQCRILVKYNVVARGCVRKKLVVCFSRDVRVSRLSFVVRCRKIDGMMSRLLASRAIAAVEYYFTSYYSRGYWKSTVLMLLIEL